MQSIGPVVVEGRCSVHDPIKYCFGAFDVEFTGNNLEVTPPRNVCEGGPGKEGVGYGVERRCFCKDVSGRYTELMD